MQYPNNNPPYVFLLSVPRSGSTWASQAISSATRSLLVNEPFNWRRHPEREKFYMRYTTFDEEKDELIDILQRATQPLYWRLLRYFKPGPIVVKDVHISLSVETIWQRLAPAIIILARHPCNLAASWSKLGLKVDFRLDLLLRQRVLMNDFLSPFESHLNNKRDYFFNIGALWGATYFILDKLMTSHPEWIFTTHESLCVDSEKRFLDLLHKMDISIDKAGKESLARFIRQHNQIERDQVHPYSIRRLSISEPNKWQSSLSDKEAISVSRGAEPFEIIEKFYPTG